MLKSVPFLELGIVSRGVGPRSRLGPEQLAGEIEDKKCYWLVRPRCRGLS